MQCAYNSLFCFYMDYEHIICHILAEAGNEGLSVRKVALHVFNESNTLFGDTTYDDIYTIVSRYLNRSVRYNDSYIKRASRKGYYCLKDNVEIRQQFLNFSDNEAENLEESYERPVLGEEDNYPSLFLVDD